MVGIVISTHGKLGDELVNTARQIVGDMPRVVTLAVEPSMSAGELRERLREAVASVDAGDGVLVFADLLGGSPCTQSLSLCGVSNIEVVTGVNLPMVIKANSLRKSGELSLRELAVQLALYGQRNITCATDLLRERAAPLM